MDISSEELLMWGDQETRESVEEKNPKAHLRHLTWIQAGCPTGNKVEKDDRRGKPRKSRWRERLREFDRQTAEELEELEKQLREEK